MRTDYGLNAGFKWFFIIFGGLSSLMLIGIPVLILAFKGRATVTEEHLEWWWLTTNRVAWDDLSAIHRAGGGGVLGAMMGPLSLVRANGKASNFPLGCFADKDQLKAQLAERSGHAVP